MKTLARLIAFVLLALGAWLPATAQTPDPAPAAAEQPAPQAPPPGGPAEVKIGIYINDIQSIDLRTHSFVADFYMWFRDSDPEIVPGASVELMNKFAPTDHEHIPLTDAPQAQPDGSSYELYRHQGQFAAKFSVKTYPLDSHELIIEIEDADWTANRLVYAVDEVSMNPLINLPGFIIGKPEIRIRNQPYPTAFGDLANPEVAPYSRATVVIPVSRPVLSGITKTFLPIFIVVMVAGAALLLSPSHVEARIGLSITALLTLVALQFNAGAGLPEVGYLLMLDQLYLASYAFVLLVVLMLVQTTSYEDKQKKAVVPDPAAAIARGGPLPAIFALLIYAAVIVAILFFNLGQNAQP